MWGALPQWAALPQPHGPVVLYKCQQSPPNGVSINGLHGLNEGWSQLRVVPPMLKLTHVPIHRHGEGAILLLLLCLPGQPLLPPTPGGASLLLLMWPP